MKSITKILLPVIGLIAIALLVFCCKGNTEKGGQTENKTIKIGAILPLSGPFAIAGENEKNGMELAISQLKSEGIDIEVKFADSKSSPKDGGIEAQRLLNIDNVDALIAVTSSLSHVVKPMAEEKKINLVTLTMDEEVAVNSPYLVRLYEGANDEASAILEYLHKNGENSRVGLLYGLIPTNENWANNIMKPKLEEKGISVPLVENYKVGERDFKVAALKIKEANLDYLVINGFGFEYKALFQELNRFDLRDKLTIIGGWGFINAELDANALDGILVSGPQYFFNRGKYASDFIKKYQTKYNESPNFDAALSYNAMLTIGRKLNVNNINEPASKIFSSDEELEGVVGKYRINDDGNMLIDTEIGIYKDGVVTLIND